MTVAGATTHPSAPVLTFWVLLLSALIALTASLQIPAGPVAVSLQTVFVLLAGFILGPAWGALCAALYLLAASLGLPIFPGEEAGFDHLRGATGGFLLAFVPAAAIAGMATRGKRRPLGILPGMAWGALALVATYALGVPWSKAALGVDWQTAFETVMLPYMPGAVVKLVLAVVTYRWLYRRRLLP